MKQSDDTGLFVKLIAESAPEANCVAVPQEQANAGSGEASIATGFPPETFIPRAAGGVPPRGQDMNGFLNRLSQSVRVLQSGYTPKFDVVFANAIGGYPAGAVVSGLNVGNFWVSVTDNNLSTPGANGATWQSLFSDYARQDWADGRYVHNNAGTSGGIIALDLGCRGQRVSTGVLTRD